jgi:hypothetical protein
LHSNTLYTAGATSEIFGGGSVTANLYMVDEGLMAFESENVFLKFLVPKKLASINKIKECNSGYIVIDTNYGEEYIDLNAIAKEINLQINFNDAITMLRSA